MGIKARVHMHKVYGEMLNEKRITVRELEQNECFYSLQNGVLEFTMFTADNWKLRLKTTTQETAD